MLRNIYIDLSNICGSCPVYNKFCRFIRQFVSDHLPIDFLLRIIKLVSSKDRKNKYNLFDIFNQDCDVSYNCNNPVAQLQCVTV